MSCLKFLPLCARRKYVITLFIVLLLYISVVFLLSESRLHYQDRLLYIKSQNIIQHISRYKEGNEQENYLVKQLKQDRSNVCPKLWIPHKVKVYDDKDISCQQHVPSNTGCQFAKDSFIYDPVKRRCDINDELKICEFYPSYIKCSYNACGDSSDHKVFLHIFDPEDGKVKAVDKVSHTDDQILKNLIYYARISIQNGYGFLFVSCDLDIKRTQLILVDSIIEAVQKPKKSMTKELFYINNAIPKEKKKININVVLLDSVSRAHFYRSLKETVETFKKINTISDTEILDFELFQALHGHTAENIHALFSGFLFPKNYTDDMRESSGIGIHHLFETLKEHGYHTMYQDDMCYEAIWGLRLDLGNANDWKDMEQKTRNANIDSTGLTMASCEILKLFDLAHVFNTDVDEKICFNGKQQDAYYLEKLVYEFKNRKAMFAFTALSFAHDSFGYRTQSLDGDLASFVNKMSTAENTLTVLMADHGNTYTDFVYLDTEGKYEMFHPSLFMIIPKNVQDHFGENVMTSLRLNQKRLITILDLHHAIKNIVNPNEKEKGFLKTISKKTTCDDLPLRMPNLCVCDGVEAPMQNTTDFIGHVEFSVGHINNIISEKSPGNVCKLIVPLFFDDVLQRQDKSSIVTMFNIISEPGHNSTNEFERIAVEISSITSGSVETLEMKLQSHERLSSFGIYRPCCNVKERFRMCVCDLQPKEIATDKEGSFLYNRRTSYNYRIFDENNIKITEEIHVIESEKLLLNLRTYNERKYEDDKEVEAELMAVTFEVINLTKETPQKYNVVVTLKDVDNMKRLTATECGGVVKADSFRYLCTLVRKYSVWKGEYKYTVDFKEI